MGGWAGAESGDGSANAGVDDEQSSSEDEGAENEDKKPVHALMILQREREDRFSEATGIRKAQDRRPGHLHLLVVVNAPRECDLHFPAGRCQFDLAKTVFLRSRIGVLLDPGLNHNCAVVIGSPAEPRLST